MRLGIGHSGLGVGLGLRAVHGLQIEVVKFQSLELSRICQHLRKHQFQFLSRSHGQGAARFGADSQPVNASGRRKRAVGLYGNAKTVCVQSVHQGGIDLQQRLAAREHHQTVRCVG